MLDKLDLNEPKTKLMSEMLDALGIESTAIIGVAMGNDYITMASSNLPGVKTTMVSMLNVADLLSYKMLVLDVDAVRRIEELWDKKRGGKEQGKGRIRLLRGLFTA